MESFKTTPGLIVLLLLLVTSIVVHGQSTDYTPGIPPPRQPTPSCNVAPSAPSLAPFRVGIPSPLAPDGIVDTSPNLSITLYTSTLLDFAVPPAFAPDRRLCALQFRMPFCSELPPDYPCFAYNWVGTEQEQYSRSGVRLALKRDDDGAMDWNYTAIHQMWPGERINWETFECRSQQGRASGRDRIVRWLASAAHNFGIEYTQAGVGPKPQWTDGVGLWIVPCE